MSEIIEERRYTLVCHRCNHEEDMSSKCKSCRRGRLHHECGQGQTPGIFCDDCRRGWKMWNCKNCNQDFALAKGNVRTNGTVFENFIGILFIGVLVYGLIVFMGG